jgi:hypothetical protein
VEQFHISKCSQACKHYQVQDSMCGGTSYQHHDTTANQQPELNINKSKRNHLTEDGEHVPRTAIHHEELEDSGGKVPASPYLSSQLRHMFGEHKRQRVNGHLFSQQSNEISMPITNRSPPKNHNTIHCFKEERVPTWFEDGRERNSCTSRSISSETLAAAVASPSSLPSSASALVAAAASTISETVKEAASKASQTPDSHACGGGVDGGSV